MILKIIKENLVTVLEHHHLAIPIAVQAMRGENTAIRIVITPNSKVMIQTDLEGNEWVQQPFACIFRTKITNDYEHMQAMQKITNICNSLLRFNDSQIQYRVLQEAYLPMPVSSGSYADYHISMRVDYYNSHF